MNVIHFASAAAFRTWLTENQRSTKELWVGFWRKDSGRDGLTYSEAVDEALYFGWINGVRRKVDDLSYTNRFTPRKAKSQGSAVNLKRVEELIRQKRIEPSGLAAYAARNLGNIAKASFEQNSVSLPPYLENRFRANKQAWSFFFATSTLLSSHRALVGDQRETPGDPAPPSHHAHRRLRCWAPPRNAHAENKAYRLKFLKPAA